MVNQRIARVNELIKEQLGFIIDQEISNPRIPEFVTVHSVKTSNDLRSAQVYVTFLNDESEQTIREAVQELNAAAKYIRSVLRQRVTLRYLPSLKFHYNPSTHYAADIQRIFQGIEITPEEPEESNGSDGEERKEDRAT